MLKSSVSGQKPFLPIKISRLLPRVVFTISRKDSPSETFNELDGLLDTGAQTSTYKLSVVLTHCKDYPHRVKALVNSKDEEFSAIPLAGAIGDSAVLPALSTKLPVLVVLYTPYTKDNGDPVYMSFAFGQSL